jgi:hypothetical protein
MLRFLIGTDQPRVMDVESFPDCKGSDRKLRLFACACYHRISRLLPSSLARYAVEVAERFADGEAGVEELRRAEDRVRAELEALEPAWRASHGAERTALLLEYEALALAGQITSPEPQKAAYYASSNAYLTAAAIANPGVATHDRGFAATRVAEERAQTDLLRDIFGTLPFESPRVDSRWQIPQIVSLAQAGYEERALPSGHLDPTRLAILADALEEAGCANAGVLGHLRLPGAHVRGCWVVDLCRQDV